MCKSEKERPRVPFSNASKCVHGPYIWKYYLDKLVLEVWKASNFPARVKCISFPFVLKDNPLRQPRRTDVKYLVRVVTRSYSWNFLTFSWPNSINFSAARPPSSEKRLRIQLSMSVDVASRSLPKENFKNIQQNKNFYWLRSHFPWLFLTLLTNFFFNDFSRTLVTCDIPERYIPCILLKTRWHCFSSSSKRRFLEVVLRKRLRRLSQLLPEQIKQRLTAKACWLDPG